MKFVKLLFSEAGREGRWLLAIFLVPGLAMSAVIALVTTVSDYDQSQGPHFYLMAFFALGCAAVLWTMNHARHATTTIMSDYINRKRLSLAANVRTLDLEAYERIGTTRIQFAVGRDLQTIEEAAPIVIVLIYFAVQLISSALYVGYLSLFAFAVTFVFLAAASYFYRNSHRLAEDLSRQATARETAFRSSLDHMLHGFRELKLNVRRSDDLFDNHVVHRSRAIEEFRVSSDRGFNRGQTISDAFFLGLLGAVVFMAPYYIKDASVPAKVTLVIVFAGGAISAVIRALPMVSRANLAIDRIEELEREIAQAAKSAAVAEPAVPPSLLQGIVLQGLTYSYKDAQGQRGFTVGPCDLPIERGKLTFIVGGNGSGKSTLINMIVRLYTPDQGSLVWDGTPVSAENVSLYQQLFSVIFSDFHLFDRLYGLDVDDERVKALIDEMGLAAKVGFKDGQFSSIDLSTGQRKRLAMVTALLENRPVLIFDEWAADQDPGFRRHYYETLLPRFRAEGRTVIAVTHDDRYFDIADYIVWMEEGRIVRSEGRP